MVGLQNRALRLPALIGCVLATACSDSGPAPNSERPDPPDGMIDATSPTFEPTFSAVYTEVIGAHNCLLGLCHGEGAAGGGLSLFPKRSAHESLLAESRGFECRGLAMPIVDAGHPERSLLWHKLQPDPPCGLSMPPDRNLDARHVEQVHEWIARGAPDD
jgi:hypothetical protein